MFDLKRTGSPVLREPMPLPLTLVQASFVWAPFGYAQLRRDRCARMGHPAIASPGANSYYQSGSRARHRRAGSRSAKARYIVDFFFCGGGGGFSGAPALTFHSTKMASIGFLLRFFGLCISP